MTNTIAQNLVVAKEFMKIMGEYQDRQHNDPDFDVDAGLYDLYVDLSNLYNDNLND